jgi:hypothetical protein
VVEWTFVGLRPVSGGIAVAPPLQWTACSLLQFPARLHEQRAQGLQLAGSGQKHRLRADIWPVDFFDILAAALPGGFGPRSDRSPSEQLAAFLTVFMLPLIYACVVFLTSLDGRPMLAAVGLPVAVGALSYLVCRRLSASAAYSLWLALGCAGMCMFWAACAIFLNLFFAFL